MGRSVSGRVTTLGARAPCNADEFRLKSCIGVAWAHAILMTYEGRSMMRAQSLPLIHGWLTAVP